MPRPRRSRESVEQDARVDLYAVGVDALGVADRTPSVPRRGPGTARAATTRRGSRAPERRAEGTRLVGRLADIAMKALAFDPGLRFRSAHDMARAFGRSAGRSPPAAPSRSSSSSSLASGSAIDERSYTLADRDSAALSTCRSSRRSWVWE